MKRRYPRWLPAAAALLLGAGLLYYFASPGAGPRVEGDLQPAPPLSLPALGGATDSLGAYRGKVVLLDFWATWCDPCLEELPDLIRFHETYRERGFSLIGVSMDTQPQDSVAPFAREHKIPYPIWFADGELPRGWPVPGFPTAFLIDREGRIVRRYLGPKLYKELVEDVEELLD